MAGYGVANNNNETTNTQLNAELSDEDIKNTLVPIENEVSATVENLPFVPESNVNQMTPSITTNNTDVLSDADIKSTLVPMGADYQSELEEDVLNPTAPRGPDDDLKVGELQTGHRLYTKQYLENMFPNLDSRPFEFTDENVNELNKELLHSAKDELNTAWATGKDGAAGVKNLLRKLKRMDPEVDYSKEAPAGLRNKLVGMDTTEEKKSAINEYFGKEAAAGTDKWGNLTFINPDNGQKTIVDKPEFTMKDWIDLRDDAPLLAATMLGAWKLRAAHWVYQMVGDTGIYMSGRSATEAVEEWTGRNKETYEDVSDRLWTEAFLVMGLNLAVGTGVWGVNRMKNPIHTGVTPDSELAVKEMLRMNERRIDAGLPPVQLLASALNDNPMLARIEGILAKIPVSAQIYKVKQESIDKMIADEVEFLIKDLNITGPARNAHIQEMRKNFNKIIDEHLNFMYSKHNARFTGINPATGKKTATEGVEIAFEKQTKLFDDEYSALGTISGDSKWIHLGMSTGGRGKPSAFKQELQKEVENLKDVPILDPLKATLEKLLKTGEDAGGWINVAQYVNVKKELAKRMKGTSTNLRDLDTGRAAKLYELLEQAVKQSSKNPSRIKDKFPPGTDIGKFIKEFRDTNRRYGEYKDLYITGKGTVAEITRANAKGDDAFNLIDFFFRKDNSKNVLEMKTVLQGIPGGAKQWKTMQNSVKDILIGTKGGALRTPKELDKILDDIGEETITAWLGPKAFRNYKDLAKVSREFGERSSVKLAKEASDAKELFHSLIKDKNINTIIDARKLVGAGSKEWNTAQKHYVGELLDAASDNGILSGEKLQNILKGAEGGFNEAFIRQMFHGSPYYQRLADLADISARSARAKSSMAGGLAAGMVVLSFLTMKIGAFAKAATFGWLNSTFLTQKSLAAAWFTKKKFSDLSDTQLRAMLREASRFGDQEHLTTWENEAQKQLTATIDAEKERLQKARGRD